MTLTVIHDPTVGDVLAFETGPDGPVLRTGRTLRIKQQVAGASSETIIPDPMAIPRAGAY